MSIDVQLKKRREKRREKEKEILIDFLKNELQKLGLEYIPPIPLSDVEEYMRVNCIECSYGRVPLETCAEMRRRPKIGFEGLGWKLKELKELEKREGIKIGGTFDNEEIYKESGFKPLVCEECEKKGEWKKKWIEVIKKRKEFLMKKTEDKKVEGIQKDMQKNVQEEVLKEECGQETVKGITEEEAGFMKGRRFKFEEIIEAIKGRNSMFFRMVDSDILVLTLASLNKSYASLKSSFPAGERKELIRRAFLYYLFGMSQKDIVGILGIARSTITDWITAGRWRSIFFSFWRNAFKIEEEAVINVIKCVWENYLFPQKGDIPEYKALFSKYERGEINFSTFFVRLFFLEKKLFSGKKFVSVPYSRIDIQTATLGLIAFLFYYRAEGWRDKITHFCSVLKEEIMKVLSWVLVEKEEELWSSLEDFLSIGLEAPFKIEPRLREELRDHIMNYLGNPLLYSNWYRRGAWKEFSAILANRMEKCVSTEKRGIGLELEEDSRGKTESVKDTIEETNRVVSTEEKKESLKKKKGEEENNNEGERKGRDDIKEKKAKEEVKKAEKTGAGKGEGYEKKGMPFEVVKKGEDSYRVILDFSTSEEKRKIYEKLKEKAEEEYRTLENQLYWILKTFLL